jgi:hypothetical protein
MPAKTRLAPVAVLSTELIGLRTIAKPFLSFMGISLFRQPQPRASHKLP